MKALGKFETRSDKINSELQMVATHESISWASFADLGAPRRGNWLATGEPGEKDRRGQTFKQFERPGPHRSFPSTTQCKIYLFPLGDVSAAPNNELLRQCVEIFFCMPCQFMKVASTKNKAMKSNKPKNKNAGVPEEEVIAVQQSATENGFYGNQLETKSVHKLLAKHKPKDAFACVAFTMSDLTNNEVRFHKIVKICILEFSFI